jgi:RNA polymerase sigma-70 factor (ECF subfamily)
MSSSPRDEHGAPAIEPSLAELARAARDAWPDVPAASDFEERLRRLIDADAHRARIEVASALWLALACARGDAKALRELETFAFEAARPALARMGLSNDAIAEALQIVREKLLVAEAGAEARIVDAAAHGDLRGIVRVAAVRTALNLRRKDHRLDVGNERLVNELCADDDPEIAALKEQHRASLKAALEDALGALSAEERNVLRMHLLHGLSIDAIGRTRQVHRATAARWLAAIRDKIDRESRRLLRERKGLSDPEFDSLVRLVESRIHVSFGRVLGPGT